MSESPLPKIAHPQKRALLAAFRETGNVCLACKADGRRERMTGICRDSVPKENRYE